jgi:hypothetical protein
VVPRAVFNEVVRDEAGQPGFLQFLQIGESAAISIAYSKKARIKGR